MADQNRTQSKQNTSRGRGHLDNASSQDPTGDEAMDVDESRGRTSREPASTADDRGIGESRRNVDNIDELEDDAMIESDVDDDIDDIDESGSTR